MLPGLIYVSALQTCFSSDFQVFIILHVFLSIIFIGDIGHSAVLLSYHDHLYCKFSIENIFMIMSLYGAMLNYLTPPPDSSQQERTEHFILFFLNSSLN